MKSLTLAEELKVSILRMGGSTMELFKSRDTIIAFALLLIVNIFVLPVSSYPFEDLNKVWKELNQVVKYYDTKQYDKACSKLEKIKKWLGIDQPPDYRLGLEYPENVRRTIREYENLLKDVDGYYDDHPRFSGVIVEDFGNYAGYFIVQCGKKRKSFLYDGGLVLKGNGVWKGKKATVYYENDGITYTDDSFSHALKLVIHK